MHLLELNDVELILLKTLVFDYIQGSIIDTTNISQMYFLEKYFDIRSKLESIGG